VPLVEEFDVATGQATVRCFGCFTSGRDATGALWFTTADSRRPVTEVRNTVGLAARIRDGFGFRT
jgi:hypothetical protein